MVRISICVNMWGLYVQYYRRKMNKFSIRITWIGTIFCTYTLKHGVSVFILQVNRTVYSRSSALKAAITRNPQKKCINDWNERTFIQICYDPCQFWSPLRKTNQLLPKRSPRSLYVSKLITEKFSIFLPAFIKVHKTAHLKFVFL